VRSLGSAQFNNNNNNNNNNKFTSKFLREKKHTFIKHNSISKFVAKFTTEAFRNLGGLIFECLQIEVVKLRPVTTRKPCTWIFMKFYTGGV
jgi:hypothetical protein